jgi:hypothetical protein
MLSDLYEGIAEGFDGLEFANESERPQYLDCIRDLEQTANGLIQTNMALNTMMTPLMN